MRDALSILDMCLGYGDNITEEMVRNILGTCDQAFLFHEGYLVLSVPASIKVIGDDIFGKDGGKIIIRGE